MLAVRNGLMSMGIGCRSYAARSAVVGCAALHAPTQANDRGARSSLSWSVLPSLRITPHQHRRFAAIAKNVAVDKAHGSTEQKAARAAYIESIKCDLQALEHLHDLLSSDSSLSRQFEAFTARLAQCQPQRCSVFVTGIGKSGMVARRLASTLSAVSVRSQWIHGSEWIHGELGNLHDGDVVIVLSHSGATAELLELPALIRKRGANVLAIVGREDSPLAQSSDQALIVPATDRAECPVPSRSIIVQEAISNAIIEHLVVAMQVDQSETLQQNHPGGSIGEQYQN